MDDPATIVPAWAHNPYHVHRGIAGISRRIGMSERSTWPLLNIDAIPHRRINGVAYVAIEREIREWFNRGCPSTPGAGAEIIEAMREAVAG